MARIMLDPAVEVLRAERPALRTEDGFRYYRNGSRVKQRACRFCGTIGPSWCADYRKTARARAWEARHERTCEARKQAALRYVVVSDARLYGWGSDPFKGVSGLTPEERARVREGGLVIVFGAPTCGGRYPDYRAVRYTQPYHRYVHYVPSDELQASIAAQFARRRAAQSAR